MDTKINATILWLIETLQQFDARLPRKNKTNKKIHEFVLSISQISATKKG